MIDIKALDGQLAMISSYDNEIDALEGYRNALNDQADRVGDSIGESAEPFESFSLNALARGKKKEDMYAGIAAGGIGLGIRSIGHIARGVGYLYTECKIAKRKRQIRERKKVIANMKLAEAQKTLAWAMPWFEKNIVALNRELDSCGTDQKRIAIMHDTRKYSFEICYKCLYIIKLSEYVIATYQYWLKGENYFRSRPTAGGIMKQLLYGNNGILPGVTGDSFVKEISSQEIPARYILILENEAAIIYAPIGVSALVELSRRLKNGALKEVLDGNPVFLAQLKKMQKNKIRRFITYLAHIGNIYLIWLWDYFGWWNLLVVPLNIALFLYIYLIRDDIE
jgi:hypothetical protein